jgi:hypothetical protein
MILKCVHSEGVDGLIVRSAAMAFQLALLDLVGALERSDQFRG